MNQKKKKNNYIDIIMVLLLFIGLLLPISKDGKALKNIIQGMYVIATFLLVFMMYKKQRINKKRFYFTIILLIYLTIATIVITKSNNYHFSIYRCVTALTCFIILITSCSVLRA